MAQENRISVSFSTAEQKTINDALSAILGVLEGKAVSLQPKDRQYYGRVKYEKEIYIDKNKLHMDANPALLPNWVDKAEFDRDYDAHKVLNPMIATTEKILNLMNDTNLLLGYDLDTTANTFYGNVKSAAKNNVPGARTIYEDLKQQYPGTPKKNEPK